MNAKPWRALVTGCLLVTGGCSTFSRNDPGEGFGFISVSSPRVEGRERLINDRREQERWLRDRLDKLDKARFEASGVVDLRSSSTLSGQLAVDVDPARKLDALNLDRSTAAAQRAADDDRALAAARATQRDKVLGDLEAGRITLAEAQTRLTTLGLALAAAPVAQDASSPTRGAADTFALKPGDAAASAVAPSGDARRTTVGSTPIEAFQDRLAAREVIRNELNDIRLDDLHDLNGNSLVRLTFDTTVMPEAEASAWGVVRMTVVLPEPGMPAARRLLERAKDQYLLTMRESTETTYRALLQRLNDLCFAREMKGVAAGQDEAEQAAFLRAFVCATSNVGRNARRAMERHVATTALCDFGTPPDRGGRCRQTEATLGRLRMQALLLRGQGEKESPQVFEHRRRVLQRWALWTGQVLDSHLQEEFRNSVLSCFYDLKTNLTQQDKAGQQASSSRDRGDGPSGLFLQEKATQNALPVVPKVSEERCGPDKPQPEERFLALLKQSISGTVYAVTPKESVQRISEVSSSRKATEVILGLSGNVQAAGIQAALQNVRVNEALMQSMRRQPLVVGFTERGRVTQGAPEGTPSPEGLVFGWVLGPSFQLSGDGKSSRFRHVVAQRSVAAELSVPSWMDKVRIRYETHWVREDGTPVPAMPGGVHGRSGQFEVSLAATPLSALAAIDDQYLRVPQVDDYLYLDVEEGQTASVMITGRNVWRSTEVFIGAQPARLLSILPDNRGVVATFGQIDAPRGSERIGDRGVALTLITSEGRVEAGRVDIHRTSGGAAPGASAASRP